MLGCRRLAAPFWALYKDSALSLQFSRQSGVYNSRFVVVHAFILARIWRFGKFLLGELAIISYMERMRIMHFLHDGEPSDAVFGLTSSRT